MKNGDIAEVFRAAAEVLDLCADDESVFLDHKAIVLIPHHPVVGSLCFTMLPRITPAGDLERYRAIMADTQP